MAQGNLNGRCFHFDNCFWGEPFKYNNIDIIQLGELCCESGCEIEEHVQICHEISYIISGTGLFECGDRSYPVGEGDVIISPKGQKHHIVSDKYSTLRFFFLGFELPSSEINSASEKIATFFKTAVDHMKKDEVEISTVIFRVLNEFYYKEVGYEEVAGSCAKQIILLTYRNFLTKGQRKSIPFIGDGFMGASIYAIVKYVDQNIFFAKDIRSMAEELGYSYTYLSHLFKNKTGVTIQHYIAERKMNKAVYMLKYSKMSITQISEKLGYETLQSFSKAFNRIMGVSPTEYRKTLKLY